MASPPLTTQHRPTHLTIVYVAVDDLHLADYNPRTWTDSMLDRVVESMRIHGCVDPFIINGSKERFNIIIGGHLRWHAAKKLGLKVLPCVYVDEPDIEREKALNLRLNRATGEWDYTKLKEFDVELLLSTGFDDRDLANIFDNALETEADGFDVQKELEQITAPVTKPGDLIALGNNRLICGDAQDAKTVQRLAGDARMDCVYCDSPYNISVNYDSGLSGKKRYGGLQTNDNKSDEEYAEFLRVSMANALSVSKSDMHAFFYCDPRNIGLVQMLYKEAGLDHKRVCLWLKNVQNPTPQVAFSRVYEPVIYATRGDPFLAPTIQNYNEVLNKEIGTGNRLTDDVLSMLEIWIEKRLASSDYTHATEKPVTLHEKPLRRCTRPGDNILDLFGGSGSTLIACEQMKRRAFLCELEPCFCDLIIRRFEALTGAKASLLNHE